MTHSPAVPCRERQRDYGRFQEQNSYFTLTKRLLLYHVFLNSFFLNQEVKSGVWKIGGPKENPRKHIENMQTSNRAKPIGLLLWNDFNHRATVRFDLLVCFTV